MYFERFPTQLSRNKPLFPQNPFFRAKILNFIFSSSEKQFRNNVTAVLIYNLDYFGDYSHYSHYTRFMFSYRKVFVSTFLTILSLKASVGCLGECKEWIHIWTGTASAWIVDIWWSPCLSCCHLSVRPGRGSEETQINQTYLVFWREGWKCVPSLQT